MGGIFRRRQLNFLLICQLIFMAVRTIMVSPFLRTVVSVSLMTAYATMFVGFMKTLKPETLGYFTKYLQVYLNCFFFKQA